MGCVLFLWIYCTLQSDDRQGNDDAHHVTICKFRRNLGAPYVHLQYQLVWLFGHQKWFSICNPVLHWIRQTWAHNIFLLSQLEDCEPPARELLKVPQSFLQWCVWVLLPFNSRLLEKNKQGKEQWFKNIPSPVIRKICNNYSFCKNHSFCQFIFKCELRQLDLEKVYTCELRKTKILASLKTHIHSHEEKDCKRINTRPERSAVIGKWKSA